MLTEKNIENRRNGIGASEAGIVMGLNKYVSPYQLWMIKTGKMEQEDLSTVPQVYWGTVHEEQIAQEYARVMNCKVRRVTGTLFHPEHEFILCHLDRKIEGIQKLLECKFAMFHSDDWGPNGSDIVPLPYIVQVQHQLAVTGYEEGDLAVLIGGWDFRIYHFKRDEQIINKIIEECSYFWDCVKSDTPPALRDRSDAQLAYPFSNGNFREAEPDVLTALEKFKELRAQVKQIEEEKDKLSDVLTLCIKDADGLKIQDQVLATWKPTAKGNRVLRVLEARA